MVSIPRRADLRPDPTSRRADDAIRRPLVTYVDDVADAMARAKAAAGDQDTLVHGARTAQLALGAGVLDELGPEHIELERTRVSAVAVGCSHPRRPHRPPR